MLHGSCIKIQTQRKQTEIVHADKEQLHFIYGWVNYLYPLNLYNGDAVYCDIVFTIR